MAFLLQGAFGQSPAERPAFEVASIKPGNPESHQLRSMISPGGRLRGENVSLRTLIEDAYELKPFQLTGGPRWMDSDKFEVIAKGGESASTAQVRLMLQALLAERFKLTIHRDTKELPLHTLTVNGKPKLEPAKEGQPSFVSNSSGPQGNHIVFKSTSMARLADILSREMGQMVVDRTGLSGNFNFEVDATRDESNPNPFMAPMAPAMYQLGLKLTTSKGPVDIFVVDSAEKPSQN
jgi:uncharacterized protein (TIGR03435 family)